MNKKTYLKNKLPFLTTNLLSMIALFIFLRINKNSFDTIFLILIVWVLLVIAGLAISYHNRKKYLDSLFTTTQQLQERYLIAEVMEQPERADDKIFYQILKMAEKSMLEQIGAIQLERKAYKEYIEQWIHEIKTPITAMKLLCENYCENPHTGFSENMLLLLEKINQYIEQALYYARSEHAQKDYVIREINPFEVVHLAIADNKYLLLQNNVKIEVIETSCTIYSDEKWLRFMLNQLITNAVKYRKAQLILRFYIECQGSQIHLCVSDNGIGIAACDLPRIFEKGFTGQNGRGEENTSTGIGLYLCKRLCDKLGIGIQAVSSGEGTIIHLIFTINDFIHQVQN